MPANTPNGLPYPLGSDRVMDGDDVIKSLAQALDPAATAGLAAAAGFSLQAAVAYKMGPLCIVQASVTRTGATITGAANGNLVDTAVLTGLPAAMRPPDRIYCVMFASTAKAFWGRVDGVVQNTGNIMATAGLPSVDLANGDVLDVSAVYHL